LQTNFSKEIAAEQHCNSLLCDKFATTKSLFKFSPTKNLNTQQQNNNKNNKANDPRIRNHVVKSNGFGKRDRREFKREESMEGFKVKVSKICRGSEWERNQSARICVCVRERERGIWEAQEPQKKKREGGGHCWCYMQPTRK
jgi:hypothetical protein